MQKIILLTLFILTCSKLNAVEFDKEIPFDRNNNEFEFPTQSDGSLFLSITFPASGILSLQFGCGSSAISRIDGPGEGIILSFRSEMTCKLVLYYGGDPSSNVTGTIWMHPSTEEIKVDLNETYETKYDFNDLFDTNDSMIFSIDNAERDVTFIFKYKEEAENPFEICHGEECIKNITTYDFKKGESYKIYAKHIQVDNIWVFPSFSFLDKAKDSNSFNLAFNLWLICLLLFIL